MNDGLGALAACSSPPATRIDRTRLPNRPRAAHCPGSAAGFVTTPVLPRGARRRRSGSDVGCQQAALLGLNRASRNDRRRRSSRQMEGSDDPGEEAAVGVALLKIRDAGECRDFSSRHWQRGRALGPHAGAVFVSSAPSTTIWPCSRWPRRGAGRGAAGAPPPWRGSSAAWRSCATPSSQLQAIDVRSSPQSSTT